MGRPRKSASKISPEKGQDSSISPEQRVFDSLVQKLKGRNIVPLFPALRKRVNDLIKEVEDVDQVELVCLTLIDESHMKFATWKDFNWVHYEWIRDSLEVPDGAWKYALWAYKDKPSRETVNYWLGMWYDGVLNREDSEIQAAKDGIEKYWMHKHGVREIKEW